ncbi:MAG: hypothetical protein DWQ01_22555 [Planctomycetota bacterium]|nr:MAG: hypothetical protein DWQ01_22555 [Planctomycetota bacterium]
MKKTFLFPLVLAGLAAPWLWAQSNGDPQNPQQPQDPNGKNVRPVFVMPPPQTDPHWDTVVLDNDRSARLLEVPHGRRFVLTDLMTFQHDEFRNQPAQATDRLWLERVGDQGRKVVLDAQLKELPHRIGTDGEFLTQPLHWESGVVIGPGDELWVNYRFAGKHPNWVRRVHFSGYWENLQRYQPAEQ